MTFDARKIAALVSDQGDVFQNHVKDLVYELIADPAYRQEFAARLYQNAEFCEEITRFKREISGMSDGQAPGTWLESQMETIAEGHESAREILDIVIGELLHRRKWNEVMKKHPDTLDLLRARLK
jgi:hypothetical protein